MINTRNGVFVHNCKKNSVYQSLLNKMAWLHGCMVACIHTFVHSSLINLYVYSIVPIFLILILFTSSVNAQSTRGLINDGVDHYLNQNYVDAEVNFKKGVEQSPESFEAKFNLGDAFFKQKKYDEAIKSFQGSLASANSDMDKANVYYNIGNSLLKSNQLDQSIAAYKESLKLNPDDMEVKYNLSYALQQKKNPQQDKQQNQDDEKKDDQEKDEQNQQNQDQQQEQKDQQQNQQPQQQEQKISKEEAKRILEALKDNEKDLQKELRKIQGQKVKTEKDW